MLNKKYKYLLLIFFGVILLFVPKVNAEDDITIEIKDFKESKEYKESEQIKEEYYEMDIVKEIEKAKKERDSLYKELTSKKSEMNNLVVDKQLLDSEIKRVEKVAKLTSDKINENLISINELKIQLEELYKDIKELEIELEKKEDDFRKRIQSSSKTSFTSYFEVVLKSETFSDMLNRLNVIKKIVKTDNKKIEEYLTLSDELANKKKTKETMLKKLDEKIAELSEIRISLLKENELNKKEVTGVDNTYLLILNDYKNLNIKYEEVNNLFIELEKQKKLIENFSKYITEKVGDYGLHPLLEYKRKELIKLAEGQGIHLITVAGLRTFEEQDKLFSQGRTVDDGKTTGSIVTNAKGGQSWHNYGLSFDMAFDNGLGDPVWEQYDMNKNGLDDWEEIGFLGMSIGLEWGGTWKELLDRPHFEYTFNKDMKEIRKSYGR
jgi:peptidoglycan L-alanyl-D-glutamate endopeptidase CwlK